MSFQPEENKFKYIFLPNKCIAFILEYPDLLDAAEGCECFLQEVFAEPVGDTPAVDGAVGGAALVVHLVEGERLGVG